MYVIYIYIYICIRLMEVGVLWTGVRLFFTVVLAVAPAVTMDEASSLSRYHDREDASSMVAAGATANTTVKNSRASRESGLLCSHSHGESIVVGQGCGVRVEWRH